MGGVPVSGLGLCWSCRWSFAPYYAGARHLECKRQSLRICQEGLEACAIFEREPGADDLIIDAITEYYTDRAGFKREPGADDFITPALLREQAC
jgi:hypothetical protein